MCQMYLQHNLANSYHIVKAKKRRSIPYALNHLISGVILLHEKFLQFDWLRAVVFQLNLKYLHVKITTLLWVVV